MLNLKNKYITFFFFLSNFMPKNFFKSCHMLFSSVKISCNQRSWGLLRWVPFIERTLGGVILINLL